MLQLKFLFSNPHINTSSITGDQHVAIHVEASNNAISSMRFHDDRVCDSSLLRANQLGLEIRELKLRENLVFRFLEPIREMVSHEISTYTVFSFDPLCNHAGSTAGCIPITGC